MQKNIISNFGQAMPSNLLKLADELCCYFQVDRALIVPVLLGIISSMVHDKFMVRAHDHVTGSSFVESLSLFCIGIADSSERKSPVLKWLKSPVEKILADINKGIESKIFLQKTEYEVAKAKAKSIKKDVIKGGTDASLEQMQTLMEIEKKLSKPLINQRRLFLQDSTAIAAAEFMASQKGSGMTILDAEGSAFDAILADHRLLELLLSGFSNEAIAFERSTKQSVNIASPHAGLCILTQDVKLKTLAKKTSTWDEGFLPRSLVFIVPESAGRRQTAIGNEVTQSCESWWYNRCKYLLTYPCASENDDRQYHILELSDQAALVWREFSSYLESLMRQGTETYPLRAWLGKMGGVTARVASLYHLIENEDSAVNMQISSLHMQQACNLIAQLIPHMQEVQKLYFPVNNEIDKAITRIVSWLHEECGTIEFFKLREMYKELNIKTDVAKIACGYLASIGVLVQDFLHESPPKIGRKSTPIYGVNYYQLDIHFPQYRY